MGHTLMQPLGQPIQVQVRARLDALTKNPGPEGRQGPQACSLVEDELPLTEKPPPEAVAPPPSWGQVTLGPGEPGAFLTETHGEEKRLLLKYPRVAMGWLFSLRELSLIPVLLPSVGGQSQNNCHSSSLRRGTVFFWDRRWTA